MRTPANQPLMKLRVDLPAQTLYDDAIQSLQATAENGSFGLLAHHADFVSSLVPGVVLAVDEDGEELFFGIDHGLLVKRDMDVRIAVRRGVVSRDLASLTQTVESTFLTVDEEERVARTALSRLEVNIVRQLSQLSDPLS